MMDDPHKYARFLIQSAFDQPLSVSELELLNAHLAQCEDCQAYAQKLAELQSTLQRVIRKTAKNPVGFPPIQTIKQRSMALALRNKVLGTVGRMAVIPIFMFTFLFAAQMIGPQKIDIIGSATGSRPPAISPMIAPTPPERTIKTVQPIQSCGIVTYTVRENDSLASIAATFAIPQATIQAYNSLKSNLLEKDSELVIPICEHTPAGISTTPTVTITLVPHENTLAPSPRG